MFVAWNSWEYMVNEKQTRITDETVTWMMTISCDDWSQRVGPYLDYQILSEFVSISKLRQGEVS